MATGEVTKVLRKLSPRGSGAQGLPKTGAKIQQLQNIFCPVLHQVISKSSLPLGEEQEHKERTCPEQVEQAVS